MRRVAEEVVVKTETLELSGLAWGPEDGKRVLGLHGWLDNAATLAPLADFLDEGIRLISLDLPGHGLSSRLPPGCAYHFVDWVPTVFDAADALGWETFSLMGHSMGAGISTMAAGACPDRIESVVLLDGLGPLSSDPKFAHRAMARHIEARKGVPVQSPRVFESREEAAEKLSMAVKGLKVEAARILMERGTRAVDGGFSWSWDPRLRVASAMRLSEEHVAAYLENMGAPVLLVYATDGLPWDEKLFKGRRDKVKEITVIEMEGGHHVHMDEPEAIAKAVNRHLMG